MYVHAKVVTNKYYEMFMLFFIAASSIELCFDDADVVKGSAKANALRILDIIFCVLFGVEVRKRDLNHSRGVKGWDERHAFDEILC